MKSCPCCNSPKVKEYRVNGVWAIVCYACGFDSAEHDPKLFKLKGKKKEAER